MVGGGVSLCRSLMRLGLIDEFHRLSDGFPKSYQLELVSSAASSSGIAELEYHRRR